MSVILAVTYIQHSRDFCDMRKVTSVIIILVLFGCSKDLTEAEQFEELKSSIKFRAYTKASELTLEPTLKQINEQMKNEQVEKLTQYKLKRDFTVNEAHASMGLLWVLSMKPDFAIAESLISLGLLENETEKYRVTSIMALAMYQKGWRGLATEKSSEAREILSDESLKSELYYEQLTTYFAYGLLSLKNGDVEGTRVAFSALGALTGITWFSDATESILLIKQGRIQDGLSRLKKLSKDPNLPEHERKYIGRIIESVEKEIGDIDGEFFVIRVVGKVIFERILETDDGPFKEFIDKMESLKGKFL